MTHNTPLSPYDNIIPALEQITPVNSRMVPLPAAHGKVLGQDITADRDNPSVSLCGADGYAFNINSSLNKIPLSTANTGDIIPVLPDGHAVAVASGTPLPEGANCVLALDEANIEDNHVIPRVKPNEGMHIRPKGENATQDSIVCKQGHIIHPGVSAGLATFGLASVRVFAPVRVAILVTGSELLPVQSQPQPHQVRDSNGPTLTSFVSNRSFLELSETAHVRDDQETLTRALRHTLEVADAVMITGGISSGVQDFACKAIELCGGQTLVKNIATRPGKAALAAISPEGTPILGLPGNPQSTLMMAHLLALPLLRKRAGLRHPFPYTPKVVVNGDKKTRPFWWARPVRVDTNGQATLVSSHNSGDVPAIASSDGFVLYPPNTYGDTELPYHAW